MFEILVLHVKNIKYFAAHLSFKLYKAFLSTNFHLINCQSICPYICKGFFNSPSPLLFNLEIIQWIMVDDSCRLVEYDSCLCNGMLWFFPKGNKREIVNCINSIEYLKCLSLGGRGIFLENLRQEHGTGLFHYVCKDKLITVSHYIDCTPVMV